MILIFMFLTAALVVLFWLMYAIGDGFPHVPLSWALFALIVAALMGLGIHVETYHQVTQLIEVEDTSELCTGEEDK